MNGPDRQTARALCEEIYRRLGRRYPFRPVPRAKLLTQREADRRRALAFVEQEIQASLQRCADLERQVQPETEPA